MVRQLKSILLVIRGRREEQAAIRRAVRLAKDCGARLTALSVLRNLPPEVRILGAALPAEDLERMAIDSALADLDKALEPAQEQRCRVRIKCIWGTPFVEVIRQVLRRKHDLVMLNASAKSGLRTSLFGSMTMRLMRKCPCPIWVVKASHRRTYSRILAAVGPEYESAEAARLNRKILGWASALAALEDSELHVVHALDLFPQGISRHRAGISDAEVKRITSRARKARRQWLADLFASYNPLRHAGRIHLVEGSAAIAIPKLVRGKKMDLLVMGTVSRTGVPGFLIGNTAERILNHVGCSVLTVKPDGFVSPITVKKT